MGQEDEKEYSFPITQEERLIFLRYKSEISLYLDFNQRIFFRRKKMHLARWELKKILDIMAKDLNEDIHYSSREASTYKQIRTFYQRLVELYRS